MSFLKKLFGGGAEPKPEAAPSEDYKGFTIRATLMAAGSEHQLAGVIEKEIGGTVRSYEFIRADRFSSREEAVLFTLAKGRQIIDEQGAALFG